MTVCLFTDCNMQPENPFKNNLGISERDVAAIDTAHFTLINWVDTVINTGDISEGDTAYASFIFSNTGKTPLIILSVKPSCGCTVINYPHDLIYPDKQAIINAKFSTSHTHGYTRKTILVNINTRKNIETLLSVEANVIAHK